MQQPSAESLASYRLDPCPGQFRMNLATHLGCALILASPLFFYYSNGSPNQWFYTLGSGLTGIIWIVYEDWRFERSVPWSIRYQKFLGKLYPPLPPPDKADDMAYTPKQKGAVQLTADGLLIDRGAWLRLSKRMASRAGKAPSMKIEWREIVEWAVHGGSGSLNYYLLKLREKQFVELQRPASAGLEPPILDYVRGAGQCMVRLYDDAK